MQKQKLFNYGGLLVSVLVLIFYCSQLTTFIYPGKWSSDLYSAAGLDPFRSLPQFIWQSLMSGIAFVFGVHLALAVNIFNVLCGVLSVWLTFQISIRLRRTSSFVKSAMEEDIIARSRLVSGLISAGFLAVCMPFIITSTRINPLSFEVCLLLASTLFPVMYRNNQKKLYWLIFTVLYGIGMAEFSTFLLLSPFFAMWWIWIFWKTKNFPWKAIAAGLLLLAAGFSISLVSCWFYHKSPMAGWREFSGYWMVVKFYLVEQYHQMRYSVPKQGWLIVLLTMVLPAFFIFWNGFEVADDFFTNIGFYLFRFVLVIVAVIILFNLPGSPWRVIGSSVVLVTPYAITALWVGQLIGFFYERLSLSRHNRWKVTAVSHWPRSLLLSASLAVIAYAGYVNMAAATPRHARPIIELSQDVLSHVHQQSFIISNGLLDSSLQWQIYEQRRDIRLINRYRASSSVYMKYISTWFDDLGIESMSVMGFSPLMDVWISTHTNITEKLAIQDLPEIWTMKGYRWYPGAGVYFGRKVSESETNAVSVEESMAFIERHLEAFESVNNKPVLLKDQFRQISLFLSVFANNTGYFLAGQEQWPDARKAFDFSLKYDPNNVSALINLAEIAERTNDAAEVTRLKDQYAKITMQQTAPLSPRRLTAQYGFVRNPAIFVQEGRAMMNSGLSDIGLDRIQEALSVGGDHLPAEFALARAFFDKAQYSESLEQYRKISEKFPDSIPVWMGISQCLILMENPAEAETAFKRLEQLGVSTDELSMQRGYMQLRLGAHFEAKKLFEKGIAVETVKGPSALGLIFASSQINDQAGIDKAVVVLKTLPDYFAGQIMLYQLAINRKDLVAAREFIARTRKIQPRNVDVLEKSIQFEMIDGHEAQVLSLLETLLEVDASNSYGNYLLANIHDQKGRPDLAEAALRRALPSDVRGDAHYGMAWILQKQSRNDEALQMIDISLTRQPNNPQFVAVKGIILNAMGRNPESVELLKKAIKLRKDRAVPLFELNLAKVYLESGQKEEGRKIYDQMTLKAATFNSDEAKVYQELQTLMAKP